jgi:hypothetical protein
MILSSGGLDTFYVDESHDKTLYVVTSIAIPFLRPRAGNWFIAWPEHFEAAKAWRKQIAENLKIPASKELHGTKLMSGRGNYLYGQRQIPREDAAYFYRSILQEINFIPDGSIITVAGIRGPTMYGEDRLTRVMHALFQRMRSQCHARQVNAMTFFDQGHQEYRDLYRKARVNLLTGSRYGATRNLPLSMFVEDANEKNSKHCIFTQVADIIAFSALSKIRAERKLLDQEQLDLGFSTLYDAIPRGVLNAKASRQGDGIVRLDT